MIEVDINEYKQHKVSEVVCLSCLHRWISVRPSTCRLKDLECAGCHKQGFVIETGEEFEEEML